MTLIPCLLFLASCGQMPSPVVDGIRSVVPWGATVDTDSQISVTFEQPVDPSRFKISISPNVNLAEPQWVSDKTFVSINPQENLLPDTKYTVNIEALDPTGRPIQDNTLTTYEFTTKQTITPLPTTNTSGKAEWNKVSAWALQNIGFKNNSLDEVNNSPFQLVSVARMNNSGVAWTKSQVETVTRNKWLLSYISVGEISRFEWYWNTSLDNNLPSYVLGKNAYWSSYYADLTSQAWIAILKQHLDKIIDAGFDGAWFDVLDVYWNEGYPGGPSETNKNNAVKLACNLSQYAKTKKPGFKIMVNGAIDLIERPGYAACIDGTTAEGLYFKGNDSATSLDFRTYHERYLDMERKMGKLVVTMDYASVESNASFAVQRARSKGYVPYVSPTNQLNLLAPLR